MMNISRLQKSLPFIILPFANGNILISRFSKNKENRWEIKSS
ncbi:hypothetical protein bpmyx0001_4780 [Bacillus pseudomycoides DSM 12442]|nr:hypothetical protein bpmyx0001_4780 [Bacillus pseudomycoides DSM 12442]